METHIFPDNKHNLFSDTPVQRWSLCLFCTTKHRDALKMHMAGEKKSKQAKKATLQQQKKKPLYFVGKQSSIT